MRRKCFPEIRVRPLNTLRGPRDTIAISLDIIILAMMDDFEDFDQ
jgi:hypothetical protein